MRILRPVLAAAALVSAGHAAAETAPPGRYRLAEGPDAAGELLLKADGRFEYALAVGALDERAQGRWREVDGRTCLFTEPTPKPPVFVKAPPLAVDGQVPTLLVTWPDGRGIAGVDFRIGFDRGEPAEGYTQEYGWSLPDEAPQSPRWVELQEPIHGVTSPRFELVDADRGRLHVVLVPNDIGVVDFAGACLDPDGDRAVLHRREGPMRFVRLRG